MNKGLIKKWLYDFKNHPVEDWFEKKSNLKSNYLQAKNLLEKIKNSAFQTSDDFFEAFFEVLEHIIKPTRHNETIDLIRLSRLKNDDFQSYLKKLQYLLDEKQPVSERIDNALKNDTYKINPFGIFHLYNVPALVCDLITFNEPHQYTFSPLGGSSAEFFIRDEQNKREKQLLQIFDIEKEISEYNSNKDSYGSRFEAFNRIIREQLLEIYSLIIYEKSPQELSQNELHSGTTLMLEINEFINWIFKEKEIGIIQNCFLDKIEIKHFYSIHKELIFDDLKDKRFVFLLGENGTGKTVFLKALLISLKKHFIDNGIKKDFGFIEDIMDYNRTFHSAITFYQEGGIKDKDTVRIAYTDREKNDLALDFKNVYAYGIPRNNISSTHVAERYGFLTLFNTNEYITNINQWLQQLRFKELEANKKEQLFTVKDFELILQDILDIQDLKLVVNSKEVLFTINKRNYDFQQLSEGFQSVMNLITDLIARLIENNPNIKSLKDLKSIKAIVLIDELDLFLHPKWERQICGKLHEKFPNIQFFITTHSPILIDGILKDERIKDKNTIKIFKLDFKNHQTIIERTYLGEEVKDWTPNLLLNSQMFDDSYLERLTDEQIDNLKIENTEREIEQVQKRKMMLEQIEEKLRERFKTVKL